jgi:hypothetical protein
MLVHIPLQYDGRLSDHLLGLNDVYIVEILLLAQVAAFDLLFTGQEELIPVLLPCIDQQEDDWDAHEEDFERARELSSTNHLCEQEHQVGPGEETREDLNYGLRRLVVVGSVPHKGEEGHH